MFSRNQIYREILHYGFWLGQKASRMRLRIHITLKLRLLKTRTLKKLKHQQIVLYADLFMSSVYGTSLNRAAADVGCLFQDLRRLEVIISC